MCIVVVEDEPLIRDVLCEALEDAGFEVVGVEDGVQAMKLARAPPRRFSVLVTDFHMPGGITGYQVASEFRNVFPGIPVVIISGRPDVLDPRWQTDQNFVVLKKPFLPSHLIRSLRTILNPPSPGTHQA